MESHQDKEEAPPFKFRIVGKFKDCMTRQITEAVRIAWRIEPLNSKSEFGRTVIPRVTVEKEAWQRRKDEEEEAKKNKEQEERLNKFVEDIKKTKGNGKDSEEDTEYGNTIEYTCVAHYLKGKLKRKKQSEPTVSSQKEEFAHATGNIFEVSTRVEEDNGECVRKRLRWDAREGCHTDGDVPGGWKGEKGPKKNLELTPKPRHEYKIELAGLPEATVTPKRKRNITYQLKMPIVESPRRWVSPSRRRLRPPPPPTGSAASPPPTLCAASPPPPLSPRCQKKPRNVASTPPAPISQTSCGPVSPHLVTNSATGLCLLSPFSYNLSNSRTGSVCTPNTPQVTYDRQNYRTGLECTTSGSHSLTRTPTQKVGIKLTTTNSISKKKQVRGQAKRGSSKSLREKGKERLIQTSISDFTSAERDGRTSKANFNFNSLKKFWTDRTNCNN